MPLDGEVPLAIRRYIDNLLPEVQQRIPPGPVF